jgi:NDP-sugar pyrophosphorylase family protein
MALKQAIILAAGFGTRLAPLTKCIPKPLLPVRNKPVIVYTIEKLWQCGFTHIHINVHFRYPWIIATIKHWLPILNIPTQCVHFYIEPEILETGGGLWNIVHTSNMFAPQEYIFITAGDIWGDMETLFATHGTTTVLDSFPLPNHALFWTRPHDPNRSDILWEEQGLVSAFGLHNKPEVIQGTVQPISSLFTTWQILQAKYILDYPHCDKQSSVSMYYTPLAKQKKLETRHFMGTWLDYGTLDTYLPLVKKDPVPYQVFWHGATHTIQALCIETIPLLVPHWQENIYHYLPEERHTDLDSNIDTVDWYIWDLRIPTICIKTKINNRHTPIGNLYIIGLYNNHGLGFLLK